MPANASLSEIVTNLRINWGGSEQGNGRDWDHRTSVSYFFADSSNVRGEESDGFVAMSATQKTYARLAFELWDDIVPLNLVETTPFLRREGGLPIPADIQFAYSAFDDGGTYAATVDNDSRTNNLVRADIWMNSGETDLDGDTDIHFGSSGFNVYLHEIGHALGLTHPGPYNAGGIPEYYSIDALYAQDTQRYTVMSYFGAWEDGSSTDHWGSDGIWKYASTPLLHDIAAMQAMYGVDTETRTGDTVYGFFSNAGRMLGSFNYNPYDFTQNPNPVFCIWDAGGTDTIDASLYRTNQHINLAEGAFSSVGSLTNNIAIAFGAEIENAIGGHGNDEIRGNDLNNRLDGRDGNDNLIAGGGVDTLVGGAGADTLWGATGDTLIGGANNDTYYVTFGDTVEEARDQGFDMVFTELSDCRMTSHVEQLTFTNPEFDPTAAHTGYGNASNNTITGAAGVDTLYGDTGIDHLYGRAGDDTLNGGDLGDFLFGEDGADTLRGDGGTDRLEGGAGADRLYGGAGTDTLIGGDGKDTLTGGSSSDIFMFNSAGDSNTVWLGMFGVLDNVDTITDFVSGVDRINLFGIDANAGTLGYNDAFTRLLNPDTYGGNWTGKVWIEEVTTGGSGPFGGGIVPLLTTTTIYASTDADPLAEFQLNVIGRVTFADLML